jgi:hypothetical protein
LPLGARHLFHIIKGAITTLIRRIEDKAELAELNMALLLGLELYLKQLSSKDQTCESNQKTTRHFRDQNFAAD